MRGRPSEEVDQRGPRGYAPGVRCRRYLWQPGRRPPSAPPQRQARRESRGMGQGPEAGAGLRQGAPEVPGSGIESRRAVNTIIFSDRGKITHLGDAPPAPGIVEYCEAGRGPLSRAQRPGDIVHRIGPSAPSPSLPARSYSVTPADAAFPRSADPRERHPYYNILDRYWFVTATLRLSSRLRPEREEVETR